MFNDLPLRLKTVDNSNLHLVLRSVWCLFESQTLTSIRTGVYVREKQVLNAREICTWMCDWGSNANRSPIQPFSTFSKIPDFEKFKYDLKYSNKVQLRIIAFSLSRSVLKIIPKLDRTSIMEVLFWNTMVSRTGVLVVLDFQIPSWDSCFVSQKLAHQPRRHGQRREQGWLVSKDLGRRGRRRPEEPWSRSLFIQYDLGKFRHEEFKF